MRPEGSIRLAERLHCLTCLAVQAVKDEDVAGLAEILNERQLTLDLLGDAVLSAGAADWLRKTQTAEQAVLRAWDKVADRLAAQIRGTILAGPALQAYERSAAK